MIAGPPEILLSSLCPFGGQYWLPSSELSDSVFLSHLSSLLYFSPALSSLFGHYGPVSKPILCHTQTFGSSFSYKCCHMEHLAVHHLFLLLWLHPKVRLYFTHILAPSGWKLLTLSLIKWRCLLCFQMSFSRIFSRSLIALYEAT